MEKYWKSSIFINPRFLCWMEIWGHFCTEMFPWWEGRWRYPWGVLGARLCILITCPCTLHSLKVCLHRLCNLFATGSRLEKNWNRRAVAKVAERFSSSRQPVADWNQSRAVFWTWTKDWPRLNSIAKGLQRSPNDCQLVADWSAIEQRPVADSKIHCDLLATNRRPVGDRSPTSRRLIADWFQCHVLSNMTYSIRYVWPFASIDSCHQSPTGRRQVTSADWSPIGFNPIANMSPCLRRQVADQSQTSCKPVAD